MSYEILQQCNTGHKLTLQSLASFPTYNEARRYRSKHSVNFCYGIVRSDRVPQVNRSYEARNN